MLPAAEERIPVPASGEEIFSLAAPFATRSENRIDENALEGKKTHQGIFSRNRTIALGATWAKWPRTHQDSGQWWPKTVLGIALDANGNTLSDASGKSYSWDFENRLTQAVVPGTGTVAFKYDPLGRRIYKSSPSFTGISVYDGKDLIEEVDNSGTVLARYAFGPGLDQPLSMFRRSAASYYQADALSSATSLSNTAGTLANTYTYDSFGNPTASTGAPTNPFQYTGRQFDSETGLYYYRARYYDPGPGKFISEDPVRFEAGMNFYGYVRGNPVAYNDPLGLYGWSDAPIALLHYCGGSGTPWTTSFDSINWGSTMLDVWARIGLLAQGPCTERSAPISFTMGAQTAGADSAIIGRHSVRVTGVLQIHCDCTWTFQGEMSSARGYDTYTFYPSNRGPLGELSTWIGGHACTGMPFNIYLPGSLPVMDSGTIPGGTPTCCKNH
jgi:RHS repeat-associated protein